MPYPSYPDTSEVQKLSFILHEMMQTVGLYHNDTDHNSIFVHFNSRTLVTFLLNYLANKLLPTISAKMIASENKNYTAKKAKKIEHK